MKDISIKLSIIIPHFNGTKVLIGCIDSLNNCTYKDVEILVVDNGSTDDSIAVVKKKFPNVAIVSSDTNRGYAGGCNYGAEHANGKYVFALPGSSGGVTDAWDGILKHQLDINHKPCNFVELFPRLKEK